MRCHRNRGVLTPIRMVVCVTISYSIDGDSVKCKCPLQDAPDSSIGSCHTCVFEAGGYGGVCRRCRDGKFLFNQSCHDDCSVAPTHLVAYNFGSLYVCSCNGAISVLGRSYP